MRLHLLLVVVCLATTACGPTQAPTGAPPDDDDVVRDGSRLTGTGRVVALPDRAVRLCANAYESDMGWAAGQEPPPGHCEHGVDVTGVDLSALDDRREKGGAVEGRATLTGTWTDGVLVVEEQEPPRPPPGAAGVQVIGSTTYVPTESPCPLPAGGLPPTDLHENLGHAAAAMEEFSRAYPHSQPRLAVFVHDEPATYEMLLTPSPGHGSVVDREQTLRLGPRRAALQERTATGDGLHPEGAQHTIWFVDRGEHTLVAETHDVPGHDYALSQAVLARMLLSLELPEPDRMSLSPPETVDTAPADGHGLGLVEVRTGRHDGFDRVVLQLDGAGTVGWRVAYTDDPRRQGSGSPVEVAGGAVLQVVVDGVGYPVDTGISYYAGAERLDGPGHAVEEVVVGGLFEGQQQAFVGVREPLPYRVFRLADPQRVVIDVAHPPGG